MPPSADSAARVPLAGGHEDHLTASEFDRVARLIEGHAGIKLPPSKHTMVEGRLRRRLRGAGAPDFSTYCKRLSEPGWFADELPHLIDAVTTNKTDFFREPEHFELLRHRLVPELLARRKGQQPMLKLWSAASSTGAEAYTMAMVLSDLAAQRGDFRFAVLGTDISNTVLAQARRAVYPTETMSPVPYDYQQRFVMRSVQGNGRDEVRMTPKLRRSVQFHHLNLMDKSYPFDRDVDVVFLRNVLIYFEQQDQQAVIRRLMLHLRLGGYLILGHSESMIGSGLGLRQLTPSVFQKI